MSPTPLSDAELALFNWEQDLAVAAFHDPTAEAQRGIQPSWFRFEPAKSVYRAVMTLHAKGQPVVQSMVEAQINGQLDYIGGLETLRELLSRDVANEADLGAASLMVKEAADQRNLDQAAADIRQALNRSDISVVEALTIAQDAATDALAIKQPERRRFVLATAEQIEARPPPDPFIDGMFDQGAFVGLAGPPGGGKSFLALDWALTAATGLTWQQRHVLHGPTVYVSAEGAGGLGPRIAAWREHTAKPPVTTAHFLTVPVPLMEPADVTLLLNAIAQLKQQPVLIVFDTLARCMVGGDENKQQDMGRLVQGVDTIRAKTGATALVVHHMNAGAERERGSTAFRAACDTLMWLKSDQDDVLTLSCEKQKEHTPFDKQRYTLTPVSSSAVLRATHEMAPSGTELAPSTLRCLAVLHDLALTDGLSSSQWEELAGESRRSFFRARKYLHTNGLVDCDDPGARGAKYTITAHGIETLGAKVP